MEIHGLAVKLILSNRLYIRQCFKEGDFTFYKDMDM